MPMKDKILSWWNGFAERHPKAAKWFREGGMFLIISYLVTFFKYLIMLFLPSLFTPLASNGWGWPNVTASLFGISFTFNIIGYSVADGGLAYCIAVWISIVLGEFIDFPLQRKYTFKSDGPLYLQIPIFAAGVILVNLALNAFNSVWVGVAKNFLSPAIYNLGTTVVAGGICMIVFFAIEKVIFAPDFGKPKQK